MTTRIDGSKSNCDIDILPGLRKRKTHTDQKLVAVPAQQITRRYNPHSFVESLIDMIDPRVSIPPIFPPPGLEIEHPVLFLKMMMSTIVPMAAYFTLGTAGSKLDENAIAFIAVGITALFFCAAMHRFDPDPRRIKLFALAVIGGVIFQLLK